MKSIALFENCWDTRVDRSGLKALGYSSFGVNGENYLSDEGKTGKKKTASPRVNKKR